MKCHICKKDGAKRSNILLSDDDVNIDYKNPGQIYKPHCVCDECYNEYKDVDVYG